MKNIIRKRIDNQSKPMIKGDSIFKTLTLITFMFLEFMLQIGYSQSQPNIDTSEKISWQRKFDDKDRPTELIDPAGRKTLFRYSMDLSGKTIVKKTNDEGDIVELAFDDRDLLNSMKDFYGDVNYQYDDFNRLILVQRKGEPAIKYQYDIQDRIASQSVGDFYTINYTYDFLGRLSTLNTPVGTINYEYQLGQGQVIRKLSNGVKTVWEFGANGQQLKTTHIDRNNFVLAEYRYQYRPDGLIDAISEKTQNGEKVTFYKYDNVGRIIQVLDQSGSDYKYEYDMLGNRVRTTSHDGKDQLSEYDWAGRLTSFNGKECSYDAAGNLKSINIENSQFECGYNQDQQLINANNKVFYKYDGGGNLIERQVDKEKTKFISNPLSDFWQPLVTENHAGRKTMLIWDKNSPLIKITDGQIEYILHDHLGSARLIVDAKGEVKQQMDYSTFGEPKYDVSENELTVGFSGLFYDSQAKLYLTKARVYNPNLGQFMQIEPEQRTPTGSQKNLSPYAYCGHDPVNFIDTDGSWPQFIWGPENWAWPSLRIVKDDFNYFWFTPTRDEVINQIMDNSINKSQYPGDYEQAFDLTYKWRQDLDSYKVDNPGAKIPNPAEFQIAENTMFARYMPPAAALTPVWSVVHYVGEKSGIKPSSFGLDGDTWQRQTWKTVAYPIIGGIQGVVKRVDDFIAKPAYGDEISPSNVGGVSLAGAGDALVGIGQIKGLTIDANNNFILIINNGEETNLPSMRIDDIVTVFRSVYIHGEGPNVTIDPNPKDPEHSAMIIKHGKATENTYVGWVLYHADRLMKAYMLGVDNITQNDVISKVFGYEDVLNSIYFGDGVLNTSKYEGKWERFWIVPAEVNQFTTKNNDLTLFDVPLKLKTQVMKWEEGELVDDTLGTSSFGAMNFTEWFTKNYDAIAKEQYLKSPAGLGLQDSVQVFTELRQIAFITAIAEKMRDQGIAMPFWMRGYEVQQVQFEKHTPALLVTRTNKNVNAQIFGGVSLSANSKEVRQFKTIDDLKQLPKEERKHGEHTLKLANTLSTTIQEYNTQTTPLQYNIFEIENESYQTIQLPGAETKALSPCRINEVDMLIPISGGRDIHLSRHFNSFFNPKEIWGQAWTMNLPRLEKIKVPTNRSTNKVSYHAAYELLSPLNSMYARFSEIKVVPILNSQLQVPDTECDFFGLANSTPNYLTDTTLELIGKTGESWHFTENGNLIAIEKDGFRMVYLRNQTGNVRQIVGLLGRTRMASIDLKYDHVNKLKSATGKNEFGEEQTVTYEYDSSGNLSGVISAQGKLTYNYKNRWVSEKSRQETSSLDDKQNRDEIVLHRFEYNNKGQLIAKYDDHKNRVDYTLTSNQGKTILNMDRHKDDQGVSSISYDASFRPLEIRYSEGTQLIYKYPEKGGNSIEFIDLDGKKTHFTESADKTKRTIEGKNQPTFTEIYDPMGRLTQLNVDDKILLQKQWSPIGRLEAIKTENSVIQPQYDIDGLTESITLFPPGAGDQLKKWETINLDFAGRPMEIKDYSHLHIEIQYDAKGAVSQFITERNGENYGYSFSRNENSQIETIKSSWGNDLFSYDSTGVLSKLVINKTWFSKEEQATIEFKQGRLNKIKQFDGSQMEISYYNEGLSANLLSHIKCPNGLELKYFYNSMGDLSKINVGNKRQVHLDYDDKGRIIGYSFWKN